MSWSCPYLPINYYTENCYGQTLQHSFANTHFCIGPRFCSMFGYRLFRFTFFFSTLLFYSLTKTNQTFTTKKKNQILEIYQIKKSEIGKSSPISSSPFRKFTGHLPLYTWFSIHLTQIIQEEWSVHHHHHWLCLTIFLPIFLFFFPLKMETRKKKTKIEIEV